MNLAQKLSTLWNARVSRRLSILVFHKVPREPDPLVLDELCVHEFERILAFVKEHFLVLPLREAVGLLARAKLPPRSAAITFDDGYSDWDLGIIPLLCKYNTPATFFLVTEQLRGVPLWHERIVAGVRALPDVNAGLPHLGVDIGDLSTMEKRRQLVLALQNKLKYCDVRRRVELIEALEGQATMPLQIAAPFGEQQIRELHRRGFEIGAHTVRHPTLTMCSERAAREEIGACREELQAVVRAPVSLFAYPNGKADIDFSQEHVHLVKACGYTAAVTTMGGTSTVYTDAYRLPRFSPWGRSVCRIAFQMVRNIAKPTKEQVA